MRVVVSIHDLPVWSIPSTEVSRLAALLPDDQVVDARDAETRRRAFADAEVLFATRIAADEFAGAPRVKWIHSSAVGVAPLLPPNVVQSPVVVTNSKGVHSEAIAEHAVALLLALRRALHTAAARQATHEWAQAEISRHPVSPASRSEVLVVGLGTIGARVAAMCAGLGMRVVGIRRHTDAPPLLGVSRVVPPAGLHEALTTADAVVLAVPRTSETRALIGHAEIELMKPTAVLVNVARGRLIDDGALIDALGRRRIAGAGLDAFQIEPLPPDSPYWSLPNVLVSPHTAAFAGDYWAPVVDVFLENMQRYRTGQPLLNVVDKALGY